MCLTYVTKRWKDDDLQERIGYQVVVPFRPTMSKVYTSSHRPCRKTKGVVMEKFKRSDDIGLRRADKYQSGFHCFQTEKGARSWMDKFVYTRQVIVRVKATEIHTRGKQNGYCVYVSNKLEIIEEVFVGKGIREIRKNNNVPVMNP